MNLSKLSSKKSATRNKILVIVGPTASGKSALAVHIALRLGSLRKLQPKSSQTQKKHDIKGAEIISADSRQIYKGLDIGSGKITRQEMGNIPHHLLGSANLKRTFTVARYQKMARKIIGQIWRRGKLPIVCGGTGLYIESAVDGLVIPEVRPDFALRMKLEKLSVDDLYGILLKKDRRRAQSIDRKNKRRLIRATEIAMKIGKVPIKKFKPLKADILFLGVKKEKTELHELIERRLQKRLPGIIREIKKLLRNGLSQKKIENFGLEYRWVTKFVKKEISEEDMLANLLRAIRHYAKRQMTWFKRNKRINWVRDAKEAERLTAEFLGKKGA